MIRSRPVPLFCLATLLLTSTLARTQAPANNPDNPAPTQPSPTAPHYSFEVASIRPSSPDTGFSYRTGPDGFRSTGLSLSSIILLAYFPLSLSSSDRIQNAPAWVSRDRYDINAKVAQQDLKAWTNQDIAEPTVLRSMLLSMLVDRCHLQLHTVPAEIPGFALALSHRGIALHASTPGETIPDGMKLPDGGVATGERLDDGSTTWHFHNASVAALTSFMSFQSHTHILDQTGLTGRYDFALAMAPDGIRIDHGEIKDPSSVWDLRALGLRTVSTRVPTVTLVVDHIDPPSPN